MPHRKRRSDEHGGSIIEFALVFPVFLVFIIGIIEFSFVLAQNSEIKHLAREGARIAAVEDISSRDIADTLCGRLGIVDPGTFGFRADGVPGSGGDPEGTAGALGFAEASADVRTITGFFDNILGFKIDSTIRFYLEEPLDAPPQWWPNSGSVETC